MSRSAPTPCASCALSERATMASKLALQAEFLLTGAGCSADDAKAVSLFHAAALRGHRMARQYVVTYLDDDAKQALWVMWVLRSSWWHRSY